MSTSVVWNREAGAIVEDREVPSPKPGELRVEVEASGLCGTDLHIASGEFPPVRPGVTLGHEYAGRVLGVGPGVEAFGVGDRIVVDPNIPCRVCSYCHSARPHLCENPEALGVTLNGGLAEHSIVPITQAYRVPDGLPSEAAALTEPLACALHAVDLSGVRPGDSTLVLGAGPIGVLSTALLVAAGASRVLVSEPNPDRRERVREVGGEPVDPESISEAQADVVFECVGASRPWGRLWKPPDLAARSCGSGSPGRRMRSPSSLTTSSGRSSPSGAPTRTRT